MKLNNAQMIVLICVAVAFLLAVIFVPWEISIREGPRIMKYAPIWKSPCAGYTVKVEMILTEMLAILVIGAIVYVIAGSVAKGK